MILKKLRRQIQVEIRLGKGNSWKRGKIKKIRDEGKLKKGNKEKSELKEKMSFNKECGERGGTVVKVLF